MTAPQKLCFLHDRALFRAWLMSLLALVTCAQQFSDFGPFATDSYSTPVDFVAGGSSHQAKVTLTFPTSGSGSFPLILAFGGYEAATGTQFKASWYADTASRVASWGYVVMQYDLQGVVSDREEATYLQPLLNWLRVETGRGSGSPAEGLVDSSRKAVLGHGRGGKLAALQYATRTDIATAILLDPVDCSGTNTGVDYPSAVAALGGTQADCGSALLPLSRSKKTAVVIGAGYTAPQPCAPTKYNYGTFAGVLGPGTWKILVKQAGHMQFASSADIAYGKTNEACGKGSLATEDVIADAGTIAVAWLEAVFRHTESGDRLRSFGDWLEGRMTSGRLAFETLVAERSGKPRLAGMDVQ